MSWKALCTGFAFWITLTTAGDADTLSLTPTHENTLIESSAGTLSNALGNIFVGRTNQAQGSSVRRGLIEFNVAGSTIPAGATITGGTLTISDVTSGTATAQTLSLFDVLEPWGQGTSYFNGGTGTAATNGDATWLDTFYNSTTPSASLKWSNSGGDFSLTLSGSTTDTTNGQLVVWSSAGNPQMTLDIQNWLDNPGQNYGWLLQGNESNGGTAKTLGAGPHYAGTQPTLAISYVVPETSTAWLALAGLFALALMRVCRSAAQVIPRPPPSTS